MRARRVVGVALVLLLGLAAAAWGTGGETGLDEDRLGRGASVRQSGESPTGAPRAFGEPYAVTPAAINTTTEARAETAVAGTKPGDKAKSSPKPPKDGVSTDPPPPVDPPITPDEPPVRPEPEDPPTPPAPPGAATVVACTSGDMVDQITFTPPADGAVVEYSLLRSATEKGEYSLVTTAAAGATSFSAPVSTPGTWWYRVGVAGQGGAGPASASVSNGSVLMSAEVTPAGRTLTASNGEIALTLAPGSFATTTTVTISEVSGSPTGGLISLAGIYEITPSGALGAPATVKIAYTLPVEHFQVVRGILAAAGLMTYDEGTRAWVTTPGGLTADGMYLSGELTHFSYWTLATVQPHGTSNTAYCSTGPGTEGGFCHDLSAAPGSTIRYSSRDSQICYNCHGSADSMGPPVGANPSSPNIQADFGLAGSRHPVATGGLYCTACHDPHADPVASPGLLKSWNPVTGTYLAGGNGLAPGTPFCWTCHGAVRNRRIDYLVSGYYAASGGDKQTGFNGAHTALGTSRVRFDSKEELTQGYADRTQIQPGGTVTIAQTNILLPKTQTPVPLPAITGDYKNAPPRPKQAYDGDTNTKVFWSRDAMGATAGNGWVGTASLTVDLGVPTQVTNFEAVYINNWSCQADVVEIQTSNDGVTWSSVVSKGTVGTQVMSTNVSLTGTGTGRYVRFVFTKLCTYTSDSVVIAEISIFGLPSQGTYVIRPDITRKATYASGVVNWQASATSPSTVTATARASLNNGTAWTEWWPVTNGGAIPTTVIASGASLQNALMEIQLTLSGAPSPVLDWVEVGITRGAITGTTPQWTGDAAPSNLCLGCHASHGANRPGLVTANASQTCTRCHSAAYGGTYVGKVAFDTSAHAAKGVPCDGCHTAHGKANGTGNSYPFLLKNTRQSTCLGSCHAGDVGAALNANQGTASEWAKHDLFSTEQVKTGSRLACNNCHATHFSSTGLVNPDLRSSAYTAMRNDPTSIPVTQVMIEASRDTLIDSTTGQETWNYGASSQFTITGSKRALLYFDLSGIPADAVIQHASLVLWGSDITPTVYTGSLGVYPATRDWLEGSGTGAPNSSSLNGATWLERRYGDNANTGDTVGGDWAVPGGDWSSAYTASAGVGATVVTDIVKWQRTNGNYGLVVLGSSDANYPIYARHSSPGSQRSPRLRVWYQTGSATRQVVDDITFCTKCHDGTMPLGLSGQAVAAVGFNWQYAVHGSGKGKGPESAAFRSYFAMDEGGGGLKAPYSYGMDALPCTTCHDPHGSSLPYHLKETVNGQVMTPIYGSGWTYGSATSGGSLGYFCTACHILPTNHAGAATSPTSCIGGG